MTIEELKEIVKDATQQAFDGERISPDEKGAIWPTIAGERLWFRTILDSVETEPIKHGHWIRTGKERPGAPESIRCSECGFWYIKLTPRFYCSNCGAKMDGEEND